MSLQDDKPPSKLKLEKNKKKSPIRWVIKIILWTFALSLTMSFISTAVISSVAIITAFFILLVFILIGIIFDILGVAVTAADDAPFHSMKSKRVKGSKEGVWLIYNAEKVANFCNDVVGDIAGIVSGASGAIIVDTITNDSEDFFMTVFSLVVTALIAAITVGGKAIGKYIAIKNSESIVYFAAKAMHFAKSIFIFGRKTK